MLFEDRVVSFIIAEFRTSSEQQTVDHTNKCMSGDACEGACAAKQRNKDAMQP